MFSSEIIHELHGGRLTVSPDIDNKFQIHSCEERGVKTHFL